MGLEAKRHQKISVGPVWVAVYHPWRCTPGTNPHQVVIWTRNVHRGQLHQSGKTSLAWDTSARSACGRQPRHNAASVTLKCGTIRVLLRTMRRFCEPLLRVPGFSTVPSMPGKLTNKREPLTRATGANPLTFCCCCDPRGCGTIRGLLRSF